MAVHSARAAGQLPDLLVERLRRALGGEPDRPLGGERRYPDDHVQRLRFIGLAQELGFNFDEAGELLKLEHGAHCRAARTLGLFAWLLTLHPHAAGRTYTSYGGMCISVALIWLGLVEGATLTRWDLLRTGVAVISMAIIALGWF